MQINQAVISAGGLGTRLKSEIGNLPKILVSLGGKSLLERHLENLDAWGIEKVLLLLGEGHEVVLEFLKSVSMNFEVDIQFVVEKKPLGTGGALIAAVELLEDKFIFIHGDLFINMPLRNVEKLWKSDADFALFVHQTSHPEDSDLIEFDNEHIQRFITKPHNWPVDQKAFGNAGFYFFNKYLFEDQFALDVKTNLDHEVIPSLLQNNYQGKAIINNWEIRDIGTPSRLKKSESDLKLGLIGLKERPAIFLDRDGTLNIESGHISELSEFVLFKDAPKAIRSINDAGILVIIITNQPVIARGELTEQELSAIHLKMESTINSYGAYINGIYVCPHHPDSGFRGEITELKIECACRKPSPGLILKAIEDFGINMQKCLFIGDSWRDKQAAELANVKFLQVVSQGSTTNLVDVVQKGINIILSENSKS